MTSTNSDGSPTVVTIVAGNPTPIGTNDNATQTSQFLRNKGAVAGVFLIVGLAAASILLFIVCYIRRRRRTQRLEHDTAVASTLAAAGYNRRPLDGDDDEEKGDRRMSTPSALTHQNSSFSSAAMLVGGGAAGAHPPAAEDGNTAPSTPGVGSEFDPYAAVGTVHPPPAAVFPNAIRRDGYTPARTTSPPPPGAWQRQHTQSTSTSSSLGYGHGAKASVGSTEPLLAGYYSGAPTEPSTPAMGPTLNLAGASGGDSRARGSGTTTTTSSVYSVDEDPDSDSRPRLEVRNLPEGATLGDISRENSRRG
ncbi:hypothetical protein C8T65DRAFT_734215 [Cerioporus squamosus]|nr:hypothetical protein C8T65DRAFT_734215 [Cerioporus squamosus]